MRKQINFIRSQIRSGDLVDSVQNGVSDPEKVYRFLLDKDRFLPKHRNEGCLYTSEVESFIGGLTDEPKEIIREEWLNLKNDVKFRENIEKSLNLIDTGPDKLYGNWRELLYLVVRMEKPKVVLETGVGNGLSTAYILNALEKNGEGNLHSIDIGNKAPLPEEVKDEGMGWLVPDHLNDRWNIKIGDTEKILKKAFSSRSVDMFFSDVPNEILEHEINVAQSHMESGSTVISSYPVESEAERVWKRFQSKHLRGSHTARRAFYQNTPSKTCAGKLV